MKAWHYREHRGRGFSMLGDISARAHTHTHILSLKRVRNLLQCCAVLCCASMQNGNDGSA